MSDVVSRRETDFFICLIIDGSLVFNEPDVAAKGFLFEFVTEFGTEFFDVSLPTELLFTFGDNLFVVDNELTDTDFGIDFFKYDFEFSLYKDLKF